MKLITPWIASEIPSRPVVMIYRQFPRRSPPAYAVIDEVTQQLKTDAACPDPSGDGLQGRQKDVLP